MEEAERSALVRVFLAHRLDGAALEAGARRFLDEGERSRSRRYRQDADRARFVTGRVLARAILARETGRDPASLAFTLSAAGKPTLTVAGAAQFSIAHSGDVIALALAPCAVGVDVERLDHKRDISRLAGAICTPQERDALTRSADPVADFFRFWTAKEAVLKAHGLGLRIAPDAFTADMLSAGWTAIAPGPSANALSGIRFHAVDVCDGYCGAVAIAAPEARLKVKWVEARDFLDAG